MADHSHSHQSADHHADHGADDAHAGHGSGALYGMIFIMLCVLTALSFGSFYVFKGTPKIGWAVMMAISCMKAGLVIMFFMHLIWEANWKYVLTFPAMFMSIFLVLMLVPDIGWRMDNYDYYRKLGAAEPAAVVEYQAGIINHQEEALQRAEKAAAAESTSGALAPAH